MNQSLEPEIVLHLNTPFKEKEKCLEANFSTCHTAWHPTTNNNKEKKGRYCVRKRGGRSWWPRYCSNEVHCKGGVSLFLVIDERPSQELVITTCENSHGRGVSLKVEGGRWITLWWRNSFFDDTFFAVVFGKKLVISRLTFSSFFGRKFFLWGGSGLNVFSLDGTFGGSVTQVM